MELGVTFLVVAIAVVAIWIIIELKRLKHKIFAICLIALIIFSYLSAAFLFKDQDLDFTSIDGLLAAGDIYFSWLASVGQNLWSLSGNAIRMDWKGEDLNVSSEK